MSADDLSSLAATDARLPVKVIGRNVLYFPSLPSTMDEARHEALEGAEEGTVVIAGEQTAGRGRLKRTWLAPAGNVALSVVLYPPMHLLPSLIMLASLGVVDSIGSIKYWVYHGN
jgi:BirA family biotin operon repressor/biotin-[acetyl-CoA-carboxylase] ligase